MKIVDMKRHKIIKMGLQWPYQNAIPNSAKILPLLERNEALISWMEPNDGNINDQFPAIRFSDDQYYMLSLRQMKVEKDWLTFSCTFSDDLRTAPFSKVSMETHTTETQLCQQVLSNRYLPFAFVLTLHTGRPYPTTVNA